MSARKYAQVSPLGPPPTTAMFRAVSTLCGGGATWSAGAWSTANRLMPRMFTGASMSVRRHRASQGCSHTNAQAVGNGLSLRTRFTAPA